MKQALGRNRITRRARLVGMLAISWLCAGATVLPERGSPEEQEACTPDVFRLCSDKIPDEPQILACLQSKQEQLSPACAKVLAPTPDRHNRKRKPRTPT